MEWREFVFVAGHGERARFGVEGVSRVESHG